MDAIRRGKTLKPPDEVKTPHEGDARVAAIDRPDQGKINLEIQKKEKEARHAEKIKTAKRREDLRNAVNGSGGDGPDDGPDEWDDENPVESTTPVEIPEIAEIKRIVSIQDAKERNPKIIERENTVLAKELNTLLDSGGKFVKRQVTIDTLIVIRKFIDERVIHTTEKNTKHLAGNQKLFTTLRTTQTYSKLLDSVLWVGFLSMYETIYEKTQNKHELLDIKTRLDATNFLYTIISKLTSLDIFHSLMHKFIDIIPDYITGLRNGIGNQPDIDIDGIKWVLGTDAQGRKAAIESRQTSILKGITTGIQLEKKAELLATLTTMATELEKIRKRNNKDITSTDALVDVYIETRDRHLKGAYDDSQNVMNSVLWLGWIEINKELEKPYTNPVIDFNNKVDATNELSRSMLHTTKLPKLRSILGVIIKVIETYITHLRKN
jgi:hypothetical protein